MASIVMPAEALRAGQYSIVVFGRRSDGTQKEVGRSAFELQFAGLSFGFRSIEISLSLFRLDNSSPPLP